jgi:Calx-beta domain-containing protein
MFATPIAITVACDMPRLIGMCIAAVVLAVYAPTASASESHAMKVDATGLTSTAFFFTDRWFEGDEVETVELAAGTHFLQPGSGYVMACALVVTDAGAWAYASECDGFLSGRGTDTLKLIGFTVTLDASALSTPIFLANVSFDLFGASPRPVTLLPTFADYLVATGPGVIAGCTFGIGLDGNIAYKDEMHGCLSGRGTRTVTFNGVTVNVDARELSTETFTILHATSLVHLPSDVVQHLRLMPTMSGYHYGAWTVSGILWPSLGMTIGLDGRVDYPASADGWVSGRGTDTLVIHGYTVRIDARVAAPGAFAVPDAVTGHLDRATVHSLRLAPVSYLYFTGEPTDFRFSIRETDGTIEVAEPCAFGSGPTLFVGCRGLTVADVAVDEGSTATFAVALSGAAPVDVTVDYATTDGSATAPADYAATAGTLTIPAGQTSATIAVPVAGDGADEPDEQFRLTLANARNATIDDGEAVATIRNIDVGTGPGVPENLAAPRIRAAGSGAYTCDPGDWRNVGPAPAFTYRWLIHRTLRGRPATLATTQTYTPGPADFGYPIACQVTIAGPAGPVTATSARVFFSRAGLNALPAAYGDVRIRGIDVFQVVQPNTGARMFGYKPDGAFDAGLCGGGTPTNFRRVLGLCRLGDRDPQVVDYQGVVLDRDKVTTAIVYVDVAGAAAGDAGLTYDLELSATRAGRVSLGAPVVRQVVNPPRSDTPWIEAFERNSDFLAAGSPGIPITLPASWTSGGGSIRLHARLRFPDRLTLGTAGYGTRQCDSEYCEINDAFTLNDVPFAGFPSLRVASLSLRRITGGQAPLLGPDRVLARAGALFPGGDRLVVSPYRADLDITTAAGLTATSIAGTADFTCNGITYRSGTANNATRACRWDAVAAIVAGWIAANPARPRKVLSGASVYDIAMGVHDYPAPIGGGVEPGAAAGGRNITNVGRATPQTAAETPFFTAMATGRPVTAAAHELGHVLTAPHADSDVTPNTCGGNSNGQVGEQWAPDGTGRLQSTRFDYDPPFAGPVGYEATVDGPYLTATGSMFDPQQFDLMSYCTFGGDRWAWISARNWNRFARELADLGTRLGARGAAAGAARSAQGAGRVGLAVGVIGSDAANIMRVVPPSGQGGVPAPDPSSPFTLRSLDAAGRVLLDAGVRASVSSEAGSADGGVFAGPVAPGAASVELRRGELVLDRAVRSRPPAVRLLAPRRKVRVPGGGRLQVRWRATDPDGGALGANIDYSTDGRTWRTVYDGPSSGKATIRGSLLPASRRGRIRLRVSDGFTQRSVTSRPFVALGTPPRVEIVTPNAGHPLLAGEAATLVGAAYDDLDRPLRGSALTWFAGGKRLGRGTSVRARVPRGTRRLTLVARDRAGRTSTARLRVLVTSPRLRIVALRVPLRVGRRARSLAIRIRPSEPAVLATRGRRFRLPARPTRVTIPLPRRPAVGVLEIPFRLSARSPKAAGTLKGTFSVART